MRTLHGRTIGFILLGGCILSMFVPAQTVFAARNNYGFFSGIYVDNNPDNGQPAAAGRNVLVGGIGNYAGDKAGFIKFIEGKLNSGNKYDRIGAQFIVHTMLGHSSARRDSLTGSQMEDWRNRINSVQISLDYSRSIIEDRNSFVVDDLGGGPDAMFFDDNVGGETLVFRHATKGDVYYLRLECANPIGDMDGLPKAAKWHIEAESEVKVGSGGSWKSDGGDVKPGDRLWWQHTLTNDGPDDMDVVIGYSVYEDDKSKGTWSGAGKIRDGQSVIMKGKTNYEVRQDDVDKHICEHIRWRPVSWDDGGLGQSNWACVFVPYNYNLKPVINDSGWGQSSTETMEYGQEYTITSSIDNDGPTKSHGDVEWRLTEVVFSPGVDTSKWKDSSSTGMSDPCELLGGNKYCKDVSSKKGDTIFPSSYGVHKAGKREGGVPAAAGVDDEICYMLSVRSYSSDSRHADGSAKSPWRYSKLICRIIGKRPKVQIWGADVRSEGDVKTNISTMAGNTYGAWSEYGIMSGGRVMSSSGAGLASSAAGAPGVLQPRDYNKLTFSNNDESKLGYFGGPFSSSLPSTQKADGDVAGPVLDLESGYYVHTGDLDIDGGEVSKGKQLKIEVKGTVTITGDIFYEDTSYSKLEDLPQLIIRATSIVVNSNVSQVDAWLIATNPTASSTPSTPAVKKYVSTCNNVQDISSNMQDCGGRLQVNGLISTDQLYLRRTYGADENDLGSPAEVVNLRPDVYLWSYAESKRSGAIRTMHLNELPPRF